MTSTTQTTAGGSAGTTAAEKAKGAIQTVHGGLEKLRGEALTAADAAGDQAKDHQTVGTASRETKNVDTAVLGDAELKQGMASMTK